MWGRGTAPVSNSAQGGTSAVLGTRQSTRLRVTHSVHTCKSHTLIMVMHTASHAYVCAARHVVHTC